MSEQASGRQVWCVLVLFFLGWALTMDSGGHDGWIAVLLAGAIGLLLLALFCVPDERLDGDYFSMLRRCYGDFFGRILTALLCLYAFWGLCMTVLSAVVFLRTVSESRWPVALIAAALLAVAGLAVAGGAARMALWTEPILWIVLAALVLSLVLTLPEADVGEAQPMLADGWDGIRGRVFEVLAVPFAECWFAVAVLSGRSAGLRQNGLKAVLTAAVLLALTALRNLAVLGQAGAEQVWYPSFTAAGLVELGESFQRGEVLMSGSLMLCSVLRTAVFLCFLTDGLDSLAPRFRRTQSIGAAGLLCIALCWALAGSTQDFRSAELFYRILSLPLLSCFALLTAVRAIQKGKK